MKIIMLSSYNFLGSLVLLFLMFIIYYVIHLETDPITKRKRFIIFNKKEQAALGQLVLEMVRFRHYISYCIFNYKYN